MLIKIGFAAAITLVLSDVAGAVAKKPVDSLTRIKRECAREVGLTSVGGRGCFVLQRPFYLCVHRKGGPNLTF
jgi:hypothetical protein